MALILPSEFQTQLTSLTLEFHSNVTEVTVFLCFIIFLKHSRSQVGKPQRLRTEVGKGTKYTHGITVLEASKFCFVKVTLKRKMIQIWLNELL